MDGKQWKKEELDFLLSNYEKLSFKELSESLGRGIEGVRSKLHRMGIRKGKASDPNNKNHLINRSPIGKANHQPDSKIKERMRLKRSYPDIDRDFNKMIPVIIDKKTRIYIKEGEDPVLAKEKYLERISQKTHF
jgi:hypothetical protein